MRFFWQKKKALKVFHIGHKRIDGKDLFEQNIEYFFFNTKAFIEEDNIIGMWDRIFGQLVSKKPNIILLDLHKPRMINDYEFKRLCKFGIVLKLSDA